MLGNTLLLFLSSSLSIILRLLVENKFVCCEWKAVYVLMSCIRSSNVIHIIAFFFLNIVRTVQYLWLYARGTLVNVLSSPICCDLCAIFRYFFNEGYSALITSNCARWYPEMNHFQVIETTYSGILRKFKKEKEEVAVSGTYFLELHHPFPLLISSYIK